MIKSTLEKVCEWQNGGATGISSKNDSIQNKQKKKTTHLLSRTPPPRWRESHIYICQSPRLPPGGVEKCRGKGEKKVSDQGSPPGLRFDGSKKEILISPLTPPGRFPLSNPWFPTPGFQPLVSNSLFQTPCFKGDPLSNPLFSTLFSTTFFKSCFQPPVFNRCFQPPGFKPLVSNPALLKRFFPTPFKLGVGKGKRCGPPVPVPVGGEVHRGSGQGLAASPDPWGFSRNASGFATAMGRGQRTVRLPGG